MHPSIGAALEPPEPGRLVRRTRFLPGVALTASQIERYAAYWRALAIDALETGDVEGASEMPQPVLVAIGDSLTQGIGASEPAAGYVGRLRRALAGDGGLGPVINLSRSGARIADVVAVQLPALDEVRRQLPVAAVVCTVGSNDLVRSPRLGRAVRDMGELLAAFPDNAIIATVPARGSMVAALFNRRLRSMAAANHLAVADVGAALTSWRGRQADDRFHPNDAGYDIWTDTFSQHLRPHPPGGDERYRVGTDGSRRGLTT